MVIGKFNGTITPSLTCVLLFVAGQLVHVAADLCAQAVDHLIQSLRAAGVHADEELVLLYVPLRRTGLDVCQVDALLLYKGNTMRNCPFQSCTKVLNLHFIFFSLPATIQLSKHQT